MWNIQLRTAGLNEWLDALEQELTLAGDMLDVMEAETEALKTVWDSSAGELWREGFQSRANTVREWIVHMKKAAIAIVEVSSLLADLESNMITAAKEL